jgi:hypothetical protein
MKSIQVKVKEEFQHEFKDLNNKTGIKLSMLYQKALEYGIKVLKGLYNE